MLRAVPLAPRRAPLLRGRAALVLLRGPAAPVALAAVAATSAARSAALCFAGVRASGGRSRLGGRDGGAAAERRRPRSAACWHSRLRTGAAACRRQRGCRRPLWRPACAGLLHRLRGGRQQGCRGARCPPARDRCSAHRGRPCRARGSGRRSIRRRRRLRRRRCVSTGSSNGGSGCGLLLAAGRQLAASALDCRGRWRCLGAAGMRH